MAVTGTMNHIDISVGYPEKAFSFYEAFLTALGYERWRVDHRDWQVPDPRRASWLLRCPDGSIFGIEVRPARKESRDRRYDRYEPGPHHLAFHAASREILDAVHASMLAAGAEVLDAPADYTEKTGYTEGYYAAFYADPDGVKLEVAYIPLVNP